MLSAAVACPRVRMCKAHSYTDSSENSIFFEVDGPYRAMILPASQEEDKVSIGSFLLRLHLYGVTEPSSAAGARDVMQLSSTA